MIRNASGSSKIFGRSRSWWAALRLAVACAVRLGLPSLSSDGVVPCAQVRA
jgi:hypothetical protein